MSSGNKLDQSLDQIMTDARDVRKTNTRRVTSRRRNVARASGGPVGGIQKHTKTAKLTEKIATPAGPAKVGDGKIVVSNLPLDVSEPQIKEYFHKTIGPVKKVMLVYGPNGQSRGNATVTFVKHDSAVKAAKNLDGLNVDKRPMKIELIMGAKEVPAPPPPKSLGDRIAKPKNAAKDKPKPATAQKTSGRGRAPLRRGRNAGRGKPKSASELDAEMVDYFGNEASGPVNGAVQPVANGEAAMEDEIM